MKNILAIIGLVTMVLLLSQGCGEEDLVDNGGGGQQQDLAAKFIGTWNVDDQPARLNYKVTIERHALYEDQVKLQNFADAGGTAVAIIVGNTLVLENQPVGSGFGVEGTGSFINSKRLQFEFFLDDGINKAQRKAVFTR